MLIDLSDGVTDLGTWHYALVRVGGDDVGCLFMRWCGLGVLPIFVCVGLRFGRMFKCSHAGLEIVP